MIEIQPFAIADNIIQQINHNGSDFTVVSYSAVLVLSLKNHTVLKLNHKIKY